jgi:hypothetical protein|tara:strand:+ start:1521 stop:1721 length:201 start_codon:yes stop_codon:yes gene_type:complete
MKVGDLVRFNGGPVFKAARKRYAASGVITGVIGVEKQTTRPWPCYSVLWADGRTTNEWFSYLEVLN